MKIKPDAFDVVFALKQASLIAYEEYLKHPPDSREFDIAYQNMIHARRAYTEACVDFCDELVRMKCVSGRC